MRRLLKHRSIDPNGLPETLEELLDRLRHSTDQKRADQRMRTLSIYIPIRIMSPLRSYVSYPALDLIAKEIEAADGSIRNNEELPTCTGLHRKRYGLPCRHEIVNVIRSDGQLSVNDIDKHWWLRREEVSDACNGATVTLTDGNSHQAQVLHEFLGQPVPRVQPSPAAALPRSLATARRPSHLAYMQEVWGPAKLAYGLIHRLCALARGRGQTQHQHLP